MKLECFAFLTLLPPFLNVFKNCPSLDSTHPHVLYWMHRNMLSLCDLFMGVFPRPMQVHHSQGPYLGATCPILHSFGLGVMENEEMTDTKYVKLESGGSCTWKHTRSRRKSQLFFNRQQEWERGSLIMVGGCCRKQSLVAVIQWANCGGTFCIYWF